MALAPVCFLKYNIKFGQRVNWPVAGLCYQGGLSSPPIALLSVAGVLGLGEIACHARAGWGI